MEQNEYIQKSTKILEQFIRIENDFYTLIREYYIDAPEEKGKKASNFYKEMSGIIDSCERGVFSMREKLNTPDFIQGYDTK